MPFIHIAVVLSPTYLNKTNLNLKPITVPCINEFIQGDIFHYLDYNIEINRGFDIFVFISNIFIYFYLSFRSTKVYNIKEAFRKHPGKLFMGF